MKRFAGLGDRGAVVLLIWCALVVAANASGAGENDSTNPSPGAPVDFVERASWSGEVTTASRLEVSNPFGDLRLRYGGPNRIVEVAVVLQQIDPAAGRLELLVDETVDPAIVSIVRSSVVGVPPADSAAYRSRADMVVLVPAGLAVLARTHAGLAETSGLESDVELETAIGPIRVRSTRGSVRARSDRGAISATLLAGVTKAPQRLNTVTGSIEVWVGDSNDLDVRMSTSGRLTSDFSMQVEHRDMEEPDKVATATVGDGGLALEIGSLRGDLSLRRLMNPDRHVAPPVEDHAHP